MHGIFSFLFNIFLFNFWNTVGPQYSQNVRSGGTANVRFLQILAASVHTPHQYLINLRNCLKPAGDITNRPLICISFRHYVFTQILRCSHAVLNCASLKAEAWTYLFWIKLLKLSNRRQTRPTYNFKLP
ncbi:hypothetical protein T4E_6545 [Trichinella pseudospiralis]|uniref:Secreted protein n=1 Tax=Trichinella pseudospiralis TaxID=6337 RepID=A0A0V0Y1V8_TRIPS|nr:hypothetical protein T4E_6545 [Trichinella pseudospiralis]